MPRKAEYQIIWSKMNETGMSWFMARLLFP